MEAGGALGVFDQQDCRCGAEVSVVLGEGGGGEGMGWGSGRWKPVRGSKFGAGERGLLTWSNLALAL